MKCLAMRLGEEYHDREDVAALLRIHIDTFTSQEACTGHTVNTDLNGSPFFGIRLR